MFLKTFKLSGTFLIKENVNISCPKLYKYFHRLDQTFKFIQGIMKNLFKLFNKYSCQEQNGNL